MRFRIVADEAVVVRQKEAEVVVLNEVGGRILALVDENLDLESITERLGEEFDAPSEDLRAHVDEFVAQLVQAGVIEASS